MSEPVRFHLVSRGELRLKVEEPEILDYRRDNFELGSARCPYDPEPIKNPVKGLNPEDHFIWNAVLPKFKLW